MGKCLNMADTQAKVLAVDIYKLTGADALAAENIVSGIRKLIILEIGATFERQNELMQERGKPLK